MRNPICKNCGRLESSHYSKSSANNKDCPTVFEEEILGADWSESKKESAEEIMAKQRIFDEAVEYEVQRRLQPKRPTDVKYLGLTPTGILRAQKEED